MKNKLIISVFLLIISISTVLSLGISNYASDNTIESKLYRSRSLIAELSG